jgi:hypothetical protein
MSQLRDRMIEDLRLRGRAENTINTYVPCVHRFIEWAGVTPNKVDAGIVRSFLLYLVNERRLSPSSHDVYVGRIGRPSGFPQEPKSSRSGHNK